MKPILKFIFLLAGLIAVLAACGGGRDGGRREEARQNALAEISRYRYVPAECAFPEEYAVTPIPPLVGEDGTFTVVLTRESYENNEFTTAALRTATSVFTFSPEGKLLREEPIPLEEKTTPVCGVLTEDSLWFVAFRWGAGAGASFMRFDRSGGRLTEEVPFRDAGLENKMIPLAMAVDGEGNLTLISDKRTSLCSLNAEYGDVVFYKSRTPVRALYPGEDGAVYAVSSAGDAVTVQRVNRSTGSLEEVRRTDMRAAENGSIERRGDLLYFPAPDGVYRLSLTENGAEPEKALDFTASGILTQLSVDGYGQFCGAIDGETLLFSETQTDESGIRRRLPRLYRRISEELSSSCRVVQVAFACELEDSYRTAFVRFNRTHEDIRIVPLDYGNLGNPMQEDYGSWKMMTDILGGLICPDIVIDRQGLLDEGSFDGSPLKQLTEGRMTADLGDFLDRDPEINRETLFGCVLRAFSDGRGGVWGLSPAFGIRTWMALPEKLDGYAPDGRWTVGEFLDFCDGLGEDETPCVWFTTEGFGSWLLSDLASYIDAESGKCRFDSEEFIRWLETLASLPDPEEYGNKSPYARMSRDDLVPCFREGKIRLCSAYFCDCSSILIQPEQALGTKDFRFVGFPSHLGSGVLVESDLIFMILKDSDAREEAWELIRHFFLDETLNDGGSFERQVSLPALKTAFDAQTEYYRSVSIRRYEDGGIGFYPDSETEDPAGRKYVEEPLDEELVARFRAYLDGEGAPILERTPDAVAEIVREELSALRAGHGTAEDCAKKIQSRVSLWLAEHK